jgi:serine/threonine-protein kinase
MKECSVCRYCFPDDFNNCPTDGQRLKLSIEGDTVLDGRYQLDKRLGHGGMGIVFQARHIFLKTSYAIKVILPDLVGNDPMLVTRFRQEAMVAARLHHPNLVNVTDFGVVNSMPYLVMELIKGRSLHELLAQDGRMSPRQTLEVISEVCAGVGAAHAEGVVHRDLKPLNIMLTTGAQTGRGVKVLDFGLAKIKSGELLGSFVAAQTTGLMGSPSYMAPELWSDDEPDARTDIYSLGVIVFQMLSGEIPFRGGTIPAIMHKHLTEPPPSFAERGIKVPWDIEEVVHRALAKNREARQPSVEDFVDELREAVLAMDSAFDLTQTDLVAGHDARTVRLPEVSLELQTLTKKQRQIEDEADEVERLAHEFEEAQRRADEARQRAEEAARRKAEEEEARKRAEEEAARKLAEEEDARRRVEEAARRQAAEEAARRKAEAEIERKRLEDEARKRAEEDARNLALEVAEAKRRAEEARERAQDEDRRRSAAEAARRELEEKQAHKRAAEDVRKRKADEEAQKLAAIEADRLSREVSEAQRRADEAGKRAEEEAQKRAVEEAARRKAEEEARRLALEVEEAKRRVEEARKRVEEAQDESAEKGRRRQATEFAATLIRSKSGEEPSRVPYIQSSEQPFTQSDASLAVRSGGIIPPVTPGGPLPTETEHEQLKTLQAAQFVQQSHPSLGGSLQTQPTLYSSIPNIAAPKRTRTPAVIIGGLILLIIVGVGLSLGAYWLWRGKRPAVQSGVAGTPPSDSKPPASSTNVLKADMVRIEGGTFQMGRNDVDLAHPTGDDEIDGYNFNQYPAHPVTVDAFFMDRTEVTNAEYADFLKETKHAMPTYWREGKPPAGEELWPVTNVSVADANAFADWRTKRDGVKYRLPTEEEWEYAARNGSQATLYPWGNQMINDYANLDGNSPKPVGSYRQGASRLGIMDLIGNVWEWTSSRALHYQGNKKLGEQPHDQVVIRGGSYQDPTLGTYAMIATRRRFLDPSTKDERIGFRLVRNAQ